MSEFSDGIIWGPQLMVVVVVVGTAAIMFLGLWLLPQILSRVFDSSANNPDAEREYQRHIIWIKLQSGYSITDEEQSLVRLTDEQLMAIYDHYGNPVMIGSIGMEITSPDDMPTLEQLTSFADTPEA